MAQRPEVPVWDRSLLDWVWVGAGIQTGICHLLVRDIAFRPFPRSVIDNIAEILQDELEANASVKYTELWCCAVVQVSMDDDVAKIKNFIEEYIYMKDRIFTVVDWNTTRGTQIPVDLAAPGTIWDEERRYFLPAPQRPNGGGQQQQQQQQQAGRSSNRDSDKKTTLASSPPGLRQVSLSPEP